MIYSLETTVYMNHLQTGMNNLHVHISLQTGMNNLHISLQIGMKSKDSMERIIYSL